MRTMHPSHWGITGAVGINDIVPLLIVSNLIPNVQSIAYTDLCAPGYASCTKRLNCKTLCHSAVVHTGWGTSLYLQAQAGLLVPWGSSWQSRPTCISDRFYLGGVTSLRGFYDKQAGPREARIGPSQVRAQLHGLKLVLTHTKRQCDSWHD